MDADVRGAGGLAQRLLRLAAAAAPAPRPQRRDELAEQIRAGAPAEPRRSTARRACIASCWPQGVRCSKNTVAKLMRASRHCARRRSGAFVVRTTDSRHAHPIAANRAESGSSTSRGPTRPGRRHHLHPHGRRLAVPGGGDGPVLAQDRRLGDGRLTCAAELVCRGAGDGHGAASAAAGPVLHHSDRGVQYACDDYQALLEPARLAAEHEPPRQRTRSASASSIKLS